MNPRNQTRNVFTGIDGSSMFDTEARTSGKGLSSSAYSSCESISNLRVCQLCGA